MFNVVAWDVPKIINGLPFVVEHEIGCGFESIFEARIAIEEWYYKNSLRKHKIRDRSADTTTFYDSDLIVIYKTVDEEIVASYDWKGNLLED